MAVAVAAGVLVGVDELFKGGLDRDRAVALAFAGDLQAPGPGGAADAVEVQRGRFG